MVQASLKAVLEPVFEADFMPCSYGFRPNRRAHDAIAEIHHLSSGANKFHWVLEADIKACFDEIDHTALMDRLRARIKDKRVCALVKAFLKSGVMATSGDREETLTGTPQGGILSPLPANIALSALDEHFARQWQQEMGSYKRRVTRRKHGPGNWRLIRFADDFVLMVSGERRHAEGLREEVAACSPRWGCGWHRRRPRWSISMRASTSSASTSAGSGSEERRSNTSTPSRPRRRLHQAVQEGDPVDQGQGEGQNTQIRPAQGCGRAAGQPQPHPARVGELLPTRGVEGGVQHDRRPRVASHRPLDLPQALPAQLEGTPAPVLPTGKLEAHLRRGRVHRRIQRQGDPLPLPRQQHPDPVDTTTDSRRHRRLTTTGQGTWSARCVETRTAGAAGGSGKRAGRKASTAPRPDPTQPQSVVILSGGPSCG